MTEHHDLNLEGVPFLSSLPQGVQRCERVQHLGLVSRVLTYACAFVHACWLITYRLATLLGNLLAKCVEEGVLFQFFSLLLFEVNPALSG